MLASLRDDEGAQRLLMSRVRGSSEQAAQSWVERVRSDAAALLLVIAAKEDDVALGYVQLGGIDLVSRRAQFGICIAEAARGRGIGTEAVALTEQYLARVWNLRKLVLEVLADNAGAIAVYRRCGFREVGTLREHFHYDGRFHDVLVMEHVFA